MKRAVQGEKSVKLVLQMTDKNPQQQSKPRNWKYSNQIALEMYISKLWMYRIRYSKPAIKNLNTLLTVVYIIFWASWFLLKIIPMRKIEFDIQNQQSRIWTLS